MPHLPDTSHETHDLELVAAHAAGDAGGADLERALALVAACPECAALHRDLRAIAAALPAMPPPVRPRDFSLSPEQAASLRRRGLRGLLAAFSGPRFAFATPLGTGLAALGIVGILVASGGITTGGATSAPAEQGDATVTVQAAPGRAATGAPAATSAVAAEGPEDASAAGAPASAPSASAAPVLAVPSAGVDTMGGGEPSGAPSAPGVAGSGPAASARPGDTPLANIAPSPAAPSDGASSPAAPVPGSSAPVTEATPDALPGGGRVVDPLLLAAAFALVAGLVLLSLRVLARRTA